MKQTLLLTLCFAFWGTLVQAQNASPLELPGVDKTASYYVKFGVEGNFSRRIGAASDSLTAAADSLSNNSNTSLASYENPFQLGMGLNACLEIPTHKHLRVGVGLGYRMVGLNETRTHNYIDLSSEPIEEWATIKSRLHYLSPQGYLTGSWKYFAVSGGIKWNIFLGGKSEIDNNLPSYFNGNGVNYGVEATVDQPSVIFTTPAGIVASSDVQNGGYYRFFVNGFIQIRIQPFGEWNRPYLTIGYSPSSDNYKRNLNAADYTHVLTPEIGFDELQVPSKLESFTFGIGWSLPTGK